MVVAIVGSRNYPNKIDILGFGLRLPKDTKIISGGARGVDTWAIDAAKFYKLPYEEYPADWDKYGKSAGFKRNTTLVELADWVVAFWDGKSRGTLDTITKAHAAGKKVTVHFPNGKIRDNGLGGSL